MFAVFKQHCQSTTGGQSRASMYTLHYVNIDISVLNMNLPIWDIYHKAQIKYYRTWKNLMKTTDMNRFPPLKVGQAILSGSNLNLNFALTLKLPIKGVIPKLNLENRNRLRFERGLEWGKKIGIILGHKNSVLSWPSIFLLAYIISFLENQNPFI